MKKTSRSTRRIYWGLLVFFSAALIGYLFQLESTRSPSASAGGDKVSLGAIIQNVDGSIKYFEDRLRKSPEDVSGRIALAQVYLQNARATHQEQRYLPLADKLLDEVLDNRPDQFEALALKASLYNVLHQFEKARTLAESLIQRRPHHAYVYGILVDALVELGEYEAAVAACDRMIGLRPGIASYARAAYLRELHGDTSGAIGAMELAASSGLVGHEDRSWALYQLGQLYLSKDETDTAEVIFRGILDEHSGYPYAMGGLARVNLVRGRYEEALNLFNEAYARMPADAFLEGKLELYRLMGDEEEIAQTTAELERSFRSAEEIGENVRMEYADFLADMNQNLDTALELAAAEYHRRPDHLHALETYAWVLHKKGRSEEAIPYIERAMRLDSGDAMVHFRAGLIYESAARDSEAHFHLKKALDSNLHIESLSAAAEARERLG